MCAPDALSDRWRDIDDDKLREPVSVLILRNGIRNLWRIRTGKREIRAARTTRLSIGKDSNKAKFVSDSKPGSILDSVNRF